MSLAAAGLRLNALLKLKVENSLICLVGTGIPSVHGGMTLDNKK
jgi:hypothetical protein